MTDFNTTLASLATAAKKAGEAENKVAEKATAHAPFALEAMLSGTMSLEGWINAACDAAGVKSTKGKRNAAALREKGFGGLYNMATALKWVDDDRRRETENQTTGNIAVDILAYQFCRIDWNGDVARDYLVSKGELPAVAKGMDAETAIATAAETGEESERLQHSVDYHVAIKAPSTFAAFLKAAKAACKVESTFADRLEKMATKIAELEAGDIAASQAALAKLSDAIATAVASLATAETEAEVVNG